MIRSTWLTAVRTRRLLEILAAIPSRPPGIPADGASLRLWRACGGSIDDVRTLIEVLIGAELVNEEGRAFQRTRAGQAVIAGRRTEDRGHSDLPYSEQDISTTRHGLCSKWPQLNNRESALPNSHGEAALPPTCWRPPVLA
jgi:hypothetical protein